MIRKAKHLFYPFGAAVHCFLCRNRITAIAGRNQNGSNSPATFLSSARIFIFCGQRFSHAPHSLHKLAKWWLGRKPAVVFIYWLFPVFFWMEAALYAAKQEGYPPHRGRACNSRRPCRESGKRNETPWLRPHIPPVFPPQWSRAAHLRPPSHSPQAALVCSSH